MDFGWLAKSDTLPPAAVEGACCLLAKRLLDVFATRDALACELRGMLAAGGAAREKVARVAALLDEVVCVAEKMVAAEKVAAQMHAATLKAYGALHQLVQENECSKHFDRRRLSEDVARALGLGESCNVA